jgi:hypothetical protein
VDIGVAEEASVEGEEVEGDTKSDTIGMLRHITNVVAAIVRTLYNPFSQELAMMAKFTCKRRSSPMREVHGFQYQREPPARIEAS